MMQIYPVYKGLQKPLVYKSFQGKFIAWGIGSLLIGLVSGGIASALTNVIVGGFFTIATIAGGLALTFQKQKGGLYSKTRYKGIFIHANQLKLRYVKPQENSI